MKTSDTELRWKLLKEISTPLQCIPAGTFGVEEYAGTVRFGGSRGALYTRGEIESRPEWFAQVAVCKAHGLEICDQHDCSKSPPAEWRTDLFVEDMGLLYRLHRTAHDIAAGTVEYGDLRWRVDGDLQSVYSSTAATGWPTSAHALLERDLLQSIHDIRDGKKGSE